MLFTKVILKTMMGFEIPGRRRFDQQSHPKRLQEALPTSLTVDLHTDLVDTVNSTEFVLHVKMKLLLWLLSPTKVPTMNLYRIMNAIRHVSVCNS